MTPRREREILANYRKGVPTGDEVDSRESRVYEERALRVFRKVSSPRGLSYYTLFFKLLVAVTWAFWKDALKSRKLPAPPADFKCGKCPYLQINKKPTE